MNLAEIIHQRSVRQAGKTAIDFAGKVYSYLDLDERIKAYAALLIKLGIRPGDRLALQLDKCMDFIFLHFANLSIGGITLPLNAAYQTSEIEYFLSDSGSSLFITDRDRYLQHLPVLEKLGIKCALTGADKEPGARLLAEILEQLDSTIDRRNYPTAAADVAVICYTSGTTGRSKGAMITHRNLVSNMQALYEIWRWSDQDLLLHVLLLFHVHGLFVALHGALNAGATVIMQEKFDPARAWETLVMRQCSVFMGVPTIYQRLINHWDEMSEKPDLSRMRLFVSGSAPLSVNLFKRFADNTGFRILERYGMTETGMNTSNSYEEAGRIPGSVGFPLPGVEIRVVDDQANDVSPGLVGEVVIKGENVFRGYWQMPEKTAESFKDGWFYSGDLGYQDADDKQRLYLVGRAKELIITGGYNVYPKEIETVLETFPGVRETAVFGVPDDDFGEKVVAAVVLKDPTLTLDDKALIAYCRDHLATYKSPKEVFAISELPRNAMGKIQKNQLADDYRKNS